MDSVLKKSSQRLLDSILNVTPYTSSVADDLRASGNIGSSESQRFRTINGDVSEDIGEFGRVDDHESEERNAVDTRACSNMFKVGID